MISNINLFIDVFNVNTSENFFFFFFFSQFHNERFFSFRVYRHSKSLNIEIDRCGKCLNRFELFYNNQQTQIETTTSTSGTPKRTPNRYNLFVKEHFQRIKQDQPHLSTPQLMKQLSQEYQKKIQNENPIELPNLDQLTI